MVSLLSFIPLKTNSLFLVAHRYPNNLFNFTSSSVVGPFTRVHRKEIASLTSRRVLFAKNRSLATVEWNFFAAFLPQFVDPQRELVLQFVLMAATFVLIEIVTELCLASLAQRIRPWLQRVGQRFNQICGGLFIAIGLALPLRS